MPGLQALVPGIHVFRAAEKTWMSNPRALITGMRHRLVHAYFDINHDILWTTATESVPELLDQGDRLLSSD